MATVVVEPEPVYPVWDEIPPSEPLYLHYPSPDLELRQREPVYARVRREASPSDYTQPLFAC
eukprot:2188277-Rhodomonas_salina.1